MGKFIPRKFEALVTEMGLDDGGVASFVYECRVLKKGDIYYESNPEYLSNAGGRISNKNVVIDDTGCWNYIGEGDFWNKFIEIK